MSSLKSKGIVKVASMMNMKNRINYFKFAPEALESYFELEKYAKKTSIDRQLRELIKIRVSQINGCSYCLEMHTKEAKKLKVTDERIDGLNDWKESDLYDEKEKIALQLAENITLISELGVNDDFYNEVREHYNEKEYVELVLIINQINAWNRLGVSMGNKAEVE